VPRAPQSLHCWFERSAMAGAGDISVIHSFNRQSIVVPFHFRAPVCIRVFDMFIRANLRAALLSVVAACALFGFSVPVFADQSAAAAPVPKKVAILIFDGVQIIDYSGPYEVFADAGYDVFTVAATKRPVITAAGDGEKILPKYTFANAPQADLVVIPGGGYEAKSNSAAVAWIKRENEHDRYTMSVCNGAFTLANTGLLDGLSATTTAGNILRMRREYPKIKVVNDQRVVDNGKIITTAGLSAGIDGALHMVAVMDGEDAAQSVALVIEYNWQPNNGYVRGAMADRLIPGIDPGVVGDLLAGRRKGDTNHWEKATWFKTKLSATELFGAVQRAYEMAYAVDGPWSPGSFHMESSGPLEAALRFDDREGHHWQGAFTVEPIAADAHQFVVRIVTARAD
jgi:putative intracellular protease/amidase